MDTISFGRPYIFIYKEPNEWVLSHGSLSRWWKFNHLLSPASQGFTWQPVVTWDSSSKVEAWQSCQKAVSVHLHPSWSKRPPRLYFCWVCCVQQPAAGTFLMLYSRADTLLKQGNLQANYWHFNHTTSHHIWHCTSELGSVCLCAQAVFRCTHQAVL